MWWPRSKPAPRKRKPPRWWACAARSSTHACGEFPLPSKVMRGQCGMRPPAASSSPLRGKAIPRSRSTKKSAPRRKPRAKPRKNSQKPPAGCGTIPRWRTPVRRNRRPTPWSMATPRWFTPRLARDGSTAWRLPGSNLSAHQGTKPSPSAPTVCMISRCATTTPPCKSAGSSWTIPMRMALPSCFTGSMAGNGSPTRNPSSSPSR